MTAGSVSDMPANVQNVSQVADLIAAILDTTTNTIVIEDLVRKYTLNNKAFNASTGSQATAAQTSGVSLFNASTAKNIVVYGIRLMNSSPGQAKLTEIRKATTNPAFANAITPVSSNLGSSATSLATSTWQASATPTGTPLDQANYNSINTQEALSNGKIYLLPANANSGMTIYVDQAGAGGLWAVIFSYLEL